MNDLTEVKLMMEGGRADGFLVRHLRLEEGLCRLPRAEIEIVSKKAIAMDDLEGYVEQPAALEISRIDVGSKRRTTRWFSGIVTSVEHEGRILASQGGNVFGYRMTVSPNLVNLAYSQSNLQYADTSALDIVKEILVRYNVAYTLDNRIPDAAKEKHDYFQTEESDYSFLLGVLAACGLSFTYRMPRQAADAKQVKGPMLHIGRGTGLPYASDFARDGGQEDPLLQFSCDRERSDATYRRMDHWRMRKSIGTDRVEVGFVDNSGTEAFGSAGAANSLRRMRLNSALSAVSDKGSVGRVTEEYLKALALDTVRWQGRTACLEAMAGCRLSIHGFFDKTGGVNDKPIEALVATTVLDCRQALPSDLVGADEENVTRLGIELACMGGKQVNDDRGDAAIGRRDSLNVTGSKDSSSSQRLSDATSKPVSDGKTPTPVNGYSLVQAVVTNSNGDIKIQKDQDPIIDLTGCSVELGEGYTFTAVPLKTMDAKEGKMTVRLVMPVGGMGQGLFRVPRIGDRILVAQVVANNVSTCYLQGYLPDDAMPFSASEKESTTGVSVITGTDSAGKPVTATTGATAKNCEMLTLRYRGVGADAKVPANAVGIRRGESKQNACSELAFYNTHVGREYDPWMRERVVDFQSGRIWEEKDKKNTEVPAKKFDPFTKKSDSDKMSFDETENVLANFQSVGDMQISANKSLDINARDITISGPGWKEFQRGAQNKGGRVVMRDINEFEVKANQRIRLMVGSNSIVIDKNGILLNAARFGQTSNPFLSSSVSVIGCRGVEVSGLNVNLTGTLGASIGDTAGGKYSACAGMSGLDGALIKNVTLTDAGAKARIGGLVGTLGVSLVSDNVTGRQNPGSSEERLSAIGGMLGNWVDAYFRGSKKYSAYEGYGGFKAGSGALLAESVLKAIGDTIDTVAMAVRILSTMESLGGSWETWERPFGESKISRSDIFTILSMTAKLAAWLTVWIAITRKTIRAGFNTKVTIKPTEIVIDAPKVDMFAVKTTHNNGVVAGKDTNIETTTTEEDPGKFLGKFLKGKGDVENNLLNLFQW